MSTPGRAETLSEWRLQDRPTPDLSAVTVSVLCLVDHDDRGRRRQHTYEGVKPADLLFVMQHWLHKYPESQGYGGHQYFPQTRVIEKGFDDRLYDKVGEAPWWLEGLKSYGHNADAKMAYRASASLTNALEALASSSTWLAGYESATYDNTTNKDLDVWLSGFVTNHQSSAVTANTRIEVNCVTEIADGTWPDVFDGTTSAETVTSQGVKDGICVPVVMLNVDATTANRVYPYTKRSIAALYGGLMPGKFVLFTTQNTGQALHNTTAGTTTTTGAYVTIT